VYFGVVHARSPAHIEGEHQPEEEATDAEDGDDDAGDAQRRGTRHGHETDVEYGRGDERDHRRPNGPGQVDYQAEVLHGKGDERREQEEAEGTRRRQRCSETTRTSEVMERRVTKVCMG
jgi:hypothetical protein